MIEAFRQYLSAAWSRAARSFDVNRRRSSTFGAGAVGAAIAVPVLATPARVGARAPVAPRPTRGYRDTEQTRRYCATTRR